MKKTLVVLFAALAVAVFLWFDLDKYFELSQLRATLTSLQQWHQVSPLQSTLIYFSIYVIVAALSLPGATALTLLAGALFGIWQGVLMVSFASSIGALFGFLLARYALRDWVQKNWPTQLASVNDGILRDGKFYLFGLRTIPVFPFFLVNLLMAMTSIPAFSFYWVSQLGMLAGTLVYVNAGTQLGSIQSMNDVLSPTLWFSFALLGVLPLVLKRLNHRWQQKRRYSKWIKPTSFDRNLIVIGAGAAGLVTAYIAAAVKAKVTLIETHKMGGDCLNYGCVPSKALIQSAKVAKQIHDANQHGFTIGLRDFSFKAVMARVNAVVKQIEPHDSIERYTALGVEVRAGHARLVDPWTVEIQQEDGQTSRLTSRSIVLATGAAPFVPPLPGLTECGFVTSDTLWQTFSQMDDLPRRIVILGGGPIGCELAQALARLGAEVAQVEMASRLMIREDIEVSAFVEKKFRDERITVLTGHKAVRCEMSGDEKYLLVEHEGDIKHIAFDAIVCAVGRAARLKGYGLEELGIPAQRTIVTNDYLETLYPNIFAAGDAAGPYQFTHMAAHQAWYAAVNALFGQFKKFKVDYRVVPWTTFVDPEVARVGLNEQDATQQGVAFEVTRFEIAELDRAIAEGHDEGFIKVLTVPGKDTILGVTIVSEHAGELLSEFVLAIRWGLGLNKILATIHSYPTWTEANKYAAGVWKRQHAPERLLRWLERFHRWRLA